MLERPEFIRQKDIVLINDVPVKSEIVNELPYSATSNLNLFKALRRGTVDTYRVIENNQRVLYSISTNEHTGIITQTPHIVDSPSYSPNPYPIKQRNIHATYLDYTYYGESEVENNWDYATEICKRKDLEAKDDGFFRDSTQYYQLPHQKDVYVSERLYSNIKSLVQEIREAEPKLIVLTGKWSLFFLTGVVTLTTTQSKPGKPVVFGGISTYRASILRIHECWGMEHECIVYPIYHPVHVITMPDKLYMMDLDIQELCYMYEVIKTNGVGYYIRPDKEYIIGDTKAKALGYLEELLEVLEQKATIVAIDLETFFMSTIDCIGFAYEVDRGCCIPLCYKGNSSFWSIEDEVEILCKVREVLTHMNCLHLGQNYQYDCQYFYKLWKLDIHPAHDTMVLHHLLHNKMPKDLAFLASLYCECYAYWKDDITASATSPETRWIYNAKDCCYTLEVFNVIYEMLHATEDQALIDLYHFQIEELHPILMNAMNAGFKVNKEMKEELYSYFKGILDQVPAKVNELLGFEFNSNSTQQKKKLFKDFFGMTLKTNKKKGKEATETCDSKAMLAYLEEYPLLRPFLGTLLEYSAANKFTSTFLGMLLDDDDRARTQYRITGTAFGRLASTKNVWGRGSNFQNLPEKGKVPLYYLLQLLSQDVEDTSEEALEFVQALEVLEGDENYE